MIDLVNTPTMTLEQRQNSLKRALHSQVFFNLLDFELIAAANKIFQYGAKAQVDKDFWLTECKGNLGEVLDATGSLFVANIYIANTGHSVHRYIAGENLPTPFQVTDVRETLDVASQTAFCDMQDEMMPTLIKRGDNILARVQNVSSKSDVAEIQMVLSGYYTEAGTYLAGQTLQGVNESLEDSPRFELWKFPVDYTGHKDHILNNDRYARMVLGFGIVNANDETEGKFPNGTVQITDVYRSIRFNNLPINISFFAPKINQVRDSHLYYLPIEHFWQPFSPMKFEVVNALGASNGYEFVMLTRTV